VKNLPILFKFTTNTFSGFLPQATSIPEISRKFNRQRNWWKNRTVAEVMA